MKFTVSYILKILIFGILDILDSDLTTFRLTFAFSSSCFPAYPKLSSRKFYSSPSVRLRLMFLTPVSALQVCLLSWQRSAIWCCLILLSDWGWDTGAGLVDAGYMFGSPEFQNQMSVERFGRDEMLH